MPPRAVFTRKAERFIRAISRAPISPRVDASSGTCTVTIVGVDEQRVEREWRHAELLIERVVVADVVRENARAECGRETRHLLTDVAAADDADGCR